MGRCILCHWATRKAPILFFGEDLEFYNEIFKRMIKKKKRSLHFGANPKPGTPSSSNFVVWGFFTRRCVTPPLLQNIRLLLSKCHSGSRSSAQSPERDPLPVLPIWEMPPAQPHAASRPPALPTGPSSQKKKKRPPSWRPVTCPFQNQSIQQHVWPTPPDLVRLFMCPPSSA